MTLETLDRITTLTGFYSVVAGFIGLWVYVLLLITLSKTALVTGLCLKAALFLLVFGIGVLMFSGLIAALYSEEEGTP